MYYRCVIMYCRCIVSVLAGSVGVVACIVGVLSCIVGVVACIVRWHVTACYKCLFVHGLSASKNIQDSMMNLEQSYLAILYCNPT
jgi:hypothetical protein